MQTHNLWHCFKRVESLILFKVWSMDHVHQKLGYCSKVQISGLNFRSPNLETFGVRPENLLSFINNKHSGEECGDGPSNKVGLKVLSTVVKVCTHLIIAVSLGVSISCYALPNAFQLATFCGNSSQAYPLCKCLDSVQAALHLHTWSLSLSFFILLSSLICISHLQIYVSRFLRASSEQ